MFPITYDPAKTSENFVKTTIRQACLFGYTSILENTLKGIPYFFNSKYYDPDYLCTAYLSNSKDIISILGSVARWRGMGYNDKKIR